MTVRLNLRHKQCAAQLYAVERIVVTEPDDKSWPADRKTTVMYCPDCAELVDVTDTTIVA